MSATGWAGIARFGGIGDNLICASVLAPLKRLGYKTEVLTSENASVVYLNNPHIDKLTVKKDGEIPGGTDGTKWHASRAAEYELFAHLSHTCEHRHALFYDQTAFWWPLPYRRKLCGGSYLETVHDVLGMPHDFGPLYFPTDEERARAVRTRNEQIGGRYLTWVISGSRIDKTYPYAAMAIARIIRELDLPVVITGVGEQQAQMAQNIADHVKRQNGDTGKLHQAVTLPGSDEGGEKNWSLRRSLAQLLTSDVVVTPDTGMAWAVAMEAVPKIMLMSHASAENITKHWRNTITLHADPGNVPCWPCHRLHNDISTCVPTKDLGQAAACISDISVELIMASVQAALGSRSADDLTRRWPSNITLRDFPHRAEHPQLRIVEADV